MLPFGLIFSITDGRIFLIEINDTSIVMKSTFSGISSENLALVLSIDITLSSIRRL